MGLAQSTGNEKSGQTLFPLSGLKIIVYGENSCYEGELLHNDTRHGKGMMTYEDGSVYVGEWKDNMQNGFGVLLSPSLRYEGQWELGKREGRGYERNPNTKYFGEYKNGEKHGTGVTIKNGIIYSEKWEYGRLIDHRYLFDLPTTSISTQSLSTRTPFHTSHKKKEPPKTLDELSHDKKTKPQTNEIYYSENEYPSTFIKHRRQKDEPSPPKLPMRSSNCLSIKNWTMEELSYFLSILGMNPLSIKKACINSIQSLTDKSYLKDIGITDAYFRHFIARVFADILSTNYRLTLYESVGLPLSELEEKFKAMNIPIAKNNDILLGHKLGKGAFGSVRTAVWKTMQEKVAVKLFTSSNPHISLQDLLLEAKIMKRIHSKRVTKLLGVSLSPPALIMEYVQGISLFELIHGKENIPVRRVLEIALSIIRALGDIHRAGVLYCDLKSPNILLPFRGAMEKAESSVVNPGSDISFLLEDFFDTDNPIIKICDLGLAVCASDNYPYPKNGMGVRFLGSIGTQKWMAPEVIRGEGSSRASDIYSFGLVLWELISRRIPYHTKTPLQILARVGYLTSIPDIPSNSSSALINLILECVASTPKDRPQVTQIEQQLLYLLRTCDSVVMDELECFVNGHGDAGVGQTGHQHHLPYEVSTSRSDEILLNSKMSYGDYYKYNKLHKRNMYFDAVEYSQFLQRNRNPHMRWDMVHSHPLLSHSCASYL